MDESWYPMKHQMKPFFVWERRHFLKLINYSCSRQPIVNNYSGLVDESWYSMKHHMKHHPCFVCVLFHLGVVSSEMKHLHFNKIFYWLINQSSNQSVLMVINIDFNRAIMEWTISNGPAIVTKLVNLVFGSNIEDTSANFSLLGLSYLNKDSECSMTCCLANQFIFYPSIKQRQCTSNTKAVARPLLYTCYLCIFRAKYHLVCLHPQERFQH